MLTLSFACIVSITNSGQQILVIIEGLIFAAISASGTKKAAVIVAVNIIVVDLNSLGVHPVIGSFNTSIGSGAVSTG